MYSKNFPNLTSIKHSTSAIKHCCCPFFLDILMNGHSVITFLHLGWLILSYLPDSLLGLSPLNYFGITLEFAGPVSPQPTLLKTTDFDFWRHTAFVCGGNPCSEGLSLHLMSNFSFNSHFQAGARNVCSSPGATTSAFMFNSLCGQPFFDVQFPF